MKTPAKSGGSQKDIHAGTDCQGSTDGSCRRSRHYVVISNEFRLADFLEIPGLDLEGLVVLARIEVYEILFGQVRVHENRQWGQLAKGWHTGEVISTSFFGLEDSGFQRIEFNGNWHYSGVILTHHSVRSFGRF